MPGLYHKQINLIVRNDTSRDAAWIKPTASIIVVTYLLLLTPTLQASPRFADFDKRAKAGENLTVVFFGSSLTWGTNASDPQLTSYRALIAERLQRAYPKAHFTFRDAALGGTGSQLGVFRLERDVLRHKPDLVFVEFSANDGLTTDAKESLASYETLARRIILEGKAPVVLAIFPFQFHVLNGKLDHLKRRTSHLQIAAAYNTAVGDAAALVHEKLKSGKIKSSALWPYDRVHPNDDGYALFADAVWEGFLDAVKKGQVCKAPDKMLHGETYAKAIRYPLFKIAKLPAGWHAATPERRSASFDMLMSRWLDGVAVATNGTVVTDKDGKKKLSPHTVNDLTIKFRGSTVLLFGESTTRSCRYKLYLDGNLIESDNGMSKEKLKEFDAGVLAYLMRGNSHLVHVVATGLDATKTHTLRIEPVFTSTAVEQELRLESICIAGGDAAVLNDVKK